MRLIAASIRNPIAVGRHGRADLPVRRMSLMQAAAAAVPGHRSPEHLDLHRLARGLARGSRSAAARAAGAGAAGPARRRGDRRQRELRRQLHQPDVRDRHRHEGRAGRRDRPHEPHAARCRRTPTARSSSSAAAATIRTTRCRGSSCSCCPARRDRSRTIAASSRTSIKPRIESVPGVASVNVNAGPPDDVRITVDLAQGRGAGHRHSGHRAARGQRRRRLGRPGRRRPPPVRAALHRSLQARQISASSCSRGATAGRSSSAMSPRSR